jgi:hypothetical protein
VRDIYSEKINNWKQFGGPDLNLISVITTTKGFGGIGEALEKYLLADLAEKLHNAGVVRCHLGTADGFKSVITKPCSIESFSRKLFTLVTG